MTGRPETAPRFGSGWRRIASAALGRLSGAAPALVADVQSLLADVAGLLFPDDPLCPHCGAPSGGPGVEVVCPSCYDRLGLYSRWHPLPLEAGALAEAAALGQYRGPLRQAVHRVKFRSDRRLGLALGYLLGALALSAPGPGRVDAVVPLPLHGERAWQRGFNQAAVLAQGAARTMGRPVWEGALARVRATRQQARLGEDDRRHNVEGAFAVPPDVSVAGRRLLLVDDVATTGATLEAAARALVAAGASRVYGVVVAAQERVHGRKKVPHNTAPSPDDSGRWKR